MGRYTHLTGWGFVRLSHARNLDNEIEVALQAIAKGPTHSKPVGRRAVPLAEVESRLTELLAEVLGVERVSRTENFFDDLGADSMVLARFCARVRRRPDLPAVSMKDVYAHPTIGSLATALAGTVIAAVELASASEVPATSTSPSSPLQQTLTSEAGEGDPEQSAEEIRAGTWRR